MVITMNENLNVKVREDLNDMVSDISFKKIKTRYNERKVTQVTLFNGEVIEFKDSEGLYDLFMSYRNIGETDFIKSKRLVEETRSTAVDITDDQVDESTGTYICVLFELKNGKIYRLFPSRKFTDRGIIDNYYNLFKKKQAEQKQQKQQVK